MAGVVGGGIVGFPGLCWFCVTAPWEMGGGVPVVVAGRSNPVDCFAWLESYLKNIQISSKHRNFHNKNSIFQLSLKNWDQGAGGLMAASVKRPGS